MSSHGEPADQQSWDERYASAPALWSGRPNHLLVAAVEGGGLQPGAALDVGCGEGADAVWLARRGWRVTGVDVSTVALGRAASAAADAGVSAQISWLQLDLTATDPPAGPWDLVNVQYWHLPREQRVPLWSALAAVVAPGGTLLVGSHDADDPHAAAHHADHPERFYRPDEVVAALGPGWDVRHAGPVRWTRSGEDGEEPAVDLLVNAVRPR